MKKTKHILFQIFIISWLFPVLSANASPIGRPDSVVTGNLPTVTTRPVYNITETTARSGGTVNTDGGEAVTARGVCWGTTEAPTLADNHTVNGSDIGSFNSYITGLAPGQTYYVRAYATNSSGTAYGEALPFTTKCIPRVSLDTVRVSPSQLPYTYDNFVLDTDMQDSTAHTFYYLTTDGCDSVSNVVFVFSSTTVTACNYYTWPATGQTYYTSGTYFRPFTDAHGHQLADTLYLNIHKPTVAVASIPPVTVCENQSINFSADATGTGNVALNWSGPNNFTGSSSDVAFSSATPDMSGVYTVTATVLEGGCKATASATVAVTVNPLPKVHISGGAIICQNESVTLTATGAESYLWSTGSTSASITETPTISQTYSVVGTDENQCQNSASVSVIVNQLPEVTISGDAHICEGEIARLTAAGAMTYVWSTNATSASIDVEPTVTTTYTVEGTDENDCSSSASFTVTVGENVDDEVYAIACESYYWPLAGETYTASGTYFYQNNNTDGCINTHTLHLIVTHNEVRDISTIKCETYTWDANGETYTESGTYYATEITPTGCDITKILHLTINHGSHDEETDWGCENYMWGPNGEIYSESGDYVFEYTNLFGCPSTKTLHLTIKHGQEDEVYETARRPTYTWPVNGETYTESGDYEYRYFNEEGCLSTITLHLTLIDIEVNPTNCIQFVDGQSETCDPGEDGTAHLLIPDEIRDDCKIEWKLNNRTVYDQTSVDELPKGTYSVKVTSKKCASKNVVYFKRTFTIKQSHDCNLKLKITGPTYIPYSCNDHPTAQFCATASGGAPPYTYEGWSGNRKTVTLSDGTSIITCTVRDRNGKTATGSLKVTAKKMDCSNDPNEIAGPAGYNDSLRYVNATDKMNYTINFENDPDFATAPASRVKVTYDVPALQNIASFRLADFGFGSHIFTVPSNVSSYSQRLDVSDSLNVWVDVTAGIDIVNHQLFWIFQSIDPATGFEPSSSQMGFLPINDSLSRGEGYVNFYILPDGGVQTGDTVGAEALIVFDDNEPIGTNVWRNTFDAVAPSSRLHAELDAQDSLYCTFSFTAQDDQDGSGVRSVETFVSVNNGNYTSIGSCPPDSTLSYALENGLFYQFMSIATDNVGNVEPFKNLADTAVNYNVAPFDLLLDGTIFYENVPLSTYIGSFSTLDDDINQAFTYELVNGEGSTDNALFHIVNNELRTNTLFECSNQNEYSIRVRSTDIGGLSIEKEFLLSEVILHETPITYQRADICQGDSYNFRGRSLMASGTYSDTLVKSNGCDSIVTLFLTVNPISQTSLNQEICQGESFDFFDQTLTESGTYTHTLESAKGCDSVVTMTLVVNPVYNTPITHEICQGESFDFFGQTLTEAGTYPHTLQTAKGCDSVVTLALTVNPVYNTQITNEICQGESYDFFGQTLTEAGTYPHTLQTAKGCDSVVTLTLTVNPVYNTQLTNEICQGESFDFFGETLTEAGTYPHTLQTAKGCDSVVTLTLTVNPVFNTPISNEICQGESFDFFGQMLTAAGTYPHTLQSAKGCDSVVTLTLAVNPVYNTSITHEICQGESFDFFGQTLTEAGTYPHTLQSAKGCDSVVSLTLTVNPTYNMQIAHEMCQGESYDFFGQTLTEAGTYPHTLQTVKGCDSTVTLTLTVNPTYNMQLTHEMCQGESFDFFGQTLTEAGTYPHTLQTAKGCDSVVTLNLTVHPLYNTPISQAICQGESFDFFGQTLDADGIYTHTLQSAHGCDSTITLTLTVGSYYSTAIAQDICQGESFNFYGQTLTTAGTYTHTVQSVGGCDSVITLTLTVDPLYNTPLTHEMCQGESYDFFGQSLTASGVYAHTLQSAKGCDSVITMTLTVNPAITTDEQLTICESELPYHYINGQIDTMFQENTPHSSDILYPFSTINGCDSLFMLHVTISPTYHIYIYDTAVREHEYYFDNFVFTPHDSGTYTYDFQYSTADGCDSLVHLVLHVMYNDGLDDIVSPSLEVYPNPANTLLNIKGEDMWQIWIYNADGQLILMTNVDDAVLQQVDVSRFAVGQYFVKVLFHDERMAIRKVIIKH